MRIIHLAEQRQAIQRRVAVKIIKLGMDSKEDRRWVTTKTGHPKGVGQPTLSTDDPRSCIYLFVIWMPTNLSAPTLHFGSA